MANRLETSRLILRPLEERDLGDLVRVLNNFNVSRTTARIPFPYGRSDAEEFLAVARSAEAGALNLSITVKAMGDTVLGGISCEPRDSGNFAEIGYWLAEPMWGKGYGGEAARAVTDHAFAVAGYDRLEASYVLGNDASRCILEKLGFIATGARTCASQAAAADLAATRMMLTRSAWAEAKDRGR